MARVRTGLLLACSILGGPWGCSSTAPIDRLTLVHREVDALRAGLPSPGSPKVHSGSQMLGVVEEDEISGRTAYHLMVLAEGYERHVNEDQLRLTCDADGRVYLMRHRGGTRSGHWDGPAMGVGYVRPSLVRWAPRFTAKFDDDPPFEATYDHMRDPDLARWFLDQLTSSRTLAFKDGRADSDAAVHRFRVGLPPVGTTAGMVTMFERQCLALDPSAPNR